MNSLNRSILVSAAALTLSLTHPTDVEAGWRLEAVVEIQAHGRMALREEVAVRVAETAGRRETEHSAYLLDFTTDRLVYLDLKGKTSVELTGDARRSHEDYSSGLIGGMAGLPHPDKLGNLSARPTGRERRVGGWDCKELAVHGTPERLGMSVWLAPAAAGDREWQRRLVQTMHANGTPSRAVRDFLLSLDGLPMEVVMRVQGGSSESTLTSRVSKLKPWKPKAAQLAVPGSFTAGRDPFDEIDEAITTIATELEKHPFPGSKGLHLAAQKGDTNKIRKLLDAGEDPDGIGINKLTPIGAALMKGKPESVAFLLENGASPTARSGDGWAPLHFAAQTGSIDGYESLVKAGAPEDVRHEEFGYTPLDSAAHFGPPAMLRFLAARPSADLDTRSGGGRTPLHLAAVSGDAEKVRVLIEAGADVSAPDSGEKTPLHAAAAEKKLATVTALLKAEGVDVNAKDSWNRTPLLIASAKGSLPIVQALLKAGADPAIADKSGNTPLALATQNEKADVATYLRAQGAPDAVRDVHWAAMNGELDSLRQLLEGGADGTRLNGRGDTPMLAVLRAGKGERVIPLMLSHGVPADTPVHDGQHLIHFTVRWNRLDAFRQLVDAGVAHDAATEHGETTLHVAARWAKPETVSYLLDTHGMDPALPSPRAGSTPIHFACLNGNTDVVKLLISRGVSASLPTRQGVVPLHVAARGGHRELVELLLHPDGGNVNVGDNYDRTPLHFAAKAGQLDVVRLLLERGASPRLENSNGDTPHDVAVRSSHAGVAELLASAKR